MPDTPPLSPDAAPVSPVNNEPLTGNSETQVRPARRSRFRRLLFPTWLIICAGVLTLFGYAVWDGLQPATRVHASPALSWKDGIASHSRASLWLPLTGTLPEPVEGTLVDTSPVVEVRSTLEGRIKAVLVQEGERVHRGQPLMLLADEDWQCARARLFELLKRQESAPAADAEKSDWAEPISEPLQRAYDRVGAACERCRILSPIDGMVLHLNARPGDEVDASGVSGMGENALVTLHSGIARSVAVPLTPTEAFRVGLQRPVRISFPERGPDSPISGIITEIKGRVVDGRQSFEARIPLGAEMQKELLPGMRARVEFLVSDVEKKLRRIVFIPRDALLGEDGREAVFWVIGADNRLRKRQADRCPEWDTPGLRAVRGGAFPGEPVVILPAASLHAGQRVVIE